MKIYTTVCIFAGDNNFGGYILVHDELYSKTLPKVELSQFNSLKIAQAIIYDYLHITWAIAIKQEIFYEESIHTAHIVYSIYLEDKTTIFDTNCLWLPLKNIKDLDDASQDIIRHCMVRRF